MSQENKEIAQQESPKDSPALQLSPEQIASIVKQMKRRKLLAQSKANKIAKRRTKNKMARKSRRLNKKLKK